MRPSPATAGAAAGGWPSSGSAAATPSTRAAGTRCREGGLLLSALRRGLASCLVRLVARGRSPHPDRPELVDSPHGRQFPGGGDRSLRGLGGAPHTDDQGHTLAR